MAVKDILGLSALRPVKAKLAKLQRLAVSLEATAAQDSSIKIGGSKIGGAPDLPAGTAWPTSKLPLPRKHGVIKDYLGKLVLPDDGTITLPLIAQIALADVAKHTTLLPRQGLLSVFYDHTAWCERDAAKKKTTFHAFFHCSRVRVIYTPSTKGLERLVAPPAVPMVHDVQKLAKATAEPTLPNYESAWFSQGGPFSHQETQLKLATTQRNAYVDAMYEAYANRPLQRLLGHAHYVQPYGLENGYKTAHAALFSDETKLPSKGPALVAACQASQLLFQMRHPHFGRGGNLMFFIRNDDLAAANFSRVWVAEQ